MKSGSFSKVIFPYEVFIFSEKGNICMKRHFSPGGPSLRAWWVTMRNEGWGEGIVRRGLSILFIKNPVQKKKD